jgi:hypothetical protein
MHPMIQQRNDGLAALRVRLNTATAAMYQMIGREQPAQKITYQVVAKGVSAYHIVERVTGQVRGFRFSWKEAVNFAQMLEARAESRDAHP